MATLPRAVASVLAQTFIDFELIVVDDGSTDTTPQWLAALDDARVRVIHRHMCAGAASARNEGIRAAHSALIAFQDSDDEWLPGKLDRQLSLLQAQPQLGWVGGAYRVGKEEVSSLHLIRGSDYDSDLLVGAPFVTPTWLVRRELLLELGGFDETLPCLEDWDLIFRLADRCSFRAVPEVVLVRYGSPDSLYADIAKRRVGLEAVLTRHRRRWLRQPRRYARWCAELGRLHALHGQIEPSRHWLRLCLRQCPWLMQAWILYLASLFGPVILRRLSRSRLSLAL